MAEESLPGVASLLAAQVGYQLRLLLRTPRAAMAGIALPVLLMVLDNRGGHQDAQLPRLVTGMAVLGLTNVSFVTHAAGLVAARESGVLRRWRAGPLPAWCYFTGRIAATVAVAVGSAAVTVAAGVGLYGMRFPAGAAVTLAVAFALGALTWASVGTAATALIPSPDSAVPVLSVTYFPIVFLSGAFGASATGPGRLRTAVGYLPARPVIAIAQGAGEHEGVPSVPPADLAILGAWAVAGLVTSLFVFRWDPERR